MLFESATPGSLPEMNQHHANEDARHSGHDDHAAMFKQRFLIVLVLTFPVLLFSPSIQDWFGYSLGDVPGDQLVAPIIGFAIYFYGGWPFLTGAASEAKTWQPGMMMLITLAITVAFGASLASELTDLDLEFWWELSTLITIMLLGHWQEMRALGQARGALSALAELLPDEAERLTGDATETVPVSAIVLGDIVLVRPGARVPIDGTIAQGSADLDESVITGETNPVSKAPGDKVIAGAVVAGSAIRVRVDAVGGDTTLAGIQRMIEAAQNSKSRTQVLADQAAGVLFYVALTAGSVTALTWALLGDEDAAVIRSVGVLVIACPHALGLAIPLVIAISTGLSAKAGILVKDRLALERMRLVDTVLFDKTGTLTRGRHVLTNYAATDGDDKALLLLAAAVEQESEHPLAGAIVIAAREIGVLSEVRDFKAIPGRGVTAKVDGDEVAVGGPAMLRQLQADVPEPLVASSQAWIARGAAVLYVARNSAIIGGLALEDEVRAESRAAVNQLHESGLRIAMITGDARQVANAVAEELAIDEVFAEVLPEDKDKAVAQLQEQGRVVAMVGDGVNDAPALARADVGIAIGAGTDVAIESAGVVLASDDPRSVIGVLRLSKASYQKMLQNLAWAAGYNLFAIPLAAGVLAPVGFVLPPAIGALLMSLSTIIVAANAQLLRRIDLRPAPIT